MTPSNPRHLSPRLFVTLFFLLVTLILLTSDKGQIDGDGILRWEALHALMSRGELTADKYSIVQPLFATPLYGAADLYAKTTGVSPDEHIHLIRHVVKRFNKIIAFCIGLWMYRVLRSRAAFSHRQAAGAVLFLLFGSLLIPHARDFYSEALWTLLCMVSLTVLAHMGTKPPQNVDARLSLLLVGSTALTIPLNPLLLIIYGFLTLCLAAHRVLSTPEKTPRKLLFSALQPDILLLGASLILGASLCLLENQIRRASFFDFGYPGEGFSTPFLTGFLGQLVSPTRGLLFFTPTFLCGFILVFACKARLNAFMRQLVALSLLFCCLLLLAYSTWHAWHGAWYWGPRFALPLSVCGCLYFSLLARFWFRENAWKKGSLLCLALLSYMTYKAGVAVGQAPLIACLETSPTPESCYWQWAFTPWASWISPDDLVVLLTDRSTAVEIVCALLAFFLLRHAPITASPGNTPDGEYAPR